MCWLAPNSGHGCRGIFPRVGRTPYGGTADDTARPAIPGAHRTDTVDVVTVVSGEVYAVLESGETLLRQGDSLVQRGTMHAWHNRSESPALVASIMVAAVR